MKTAMITGSNRGIGFALLNKFAKEGYNVIAHARKKTDEWEKQCRTLEKENNISITNVYFDLSIKEEVELGLQKITLSSISIDVLINNAGVFVSKPLMYLSYEDLELSFMINYFSLVIVTKEISSIMMRNTGGSIINISSCMGSSHQPCGECYDASKAALNQFTRTIAQELAPFNIRVNAVAGGIIDTEMATNLNEKSRSKMIKATALKRVAEKREIVDVVCFLASDKASYITGSVLDVSGGVIC